jgi:iron complex outermembrane receptor protein
MTKLGMLTSAAVSVLALTAPIAAHAAAAAADTGNAVEEVIVTATKTGATNLQKTPLAVAVVGGADLEQSRIVTLRDLPSAVSALKIISNNANVVVYIRGVGGFPANNEQDVSVYMDGVYLGRTSVALQSNFNDLERVEVVKGPQGTLFGRNSVGGALNFISRAPSKTFKFQNTLNLGNYNLVDEAFSVSGPISDKVQASLSFGTVKRDGYLKNVVPNMPDIASANRQNVRAQLNWEVTDNLTNLVRADYIFTHERWATNSTLLIRTDDPRYLSCNGTTLVCTYAGYASPIANAAVGDYHKVAAPVTPFNKEMAYGISDETNWKINDNLSIKNLVAYRTDKSLNYTGGNGTEYITGATHSDFHEHTFSEEINLLHTFGNLTGVAGLYYYKEFQNQVGDSLGFTAPPVRTGAGNESYQDTRFPTKSTAAFLSETYHFTPAVAVTVGARYTKENKQLDTLNTSFALTGGLSNNVRGATSPSSIVRNTDGTINTQTTVIFPFILGYGSSTPALSQDVTNFSPKIGVEWQATENAFLYGTITKGFKSGGFNFTARNAFGAAFLPEKITAYEVGAKTDWFDRRLRVNLALFLNNWNNLQVNQSIAIEGLNTPVQVSSNAATAKLTGFEWDIIAKPLDGLTLTSSLTFMPTAEYSSYTTGQAVGTIKNLLIQAKDPRENAAKNTYDASGNRLINVPKTSFIFTAQKDFEVSNGGVVYIRGEYQYTSETEFDISNHPLVRRPAYELVNGSFGYNPAGGHWQFAVWGRNLGDTQYATTMGAGNPPNGPTINVGAPRTFGVRLNYAY